MHVFVTGGSGLTGPAVVTELIRAGHTVTGLARSDASADRLRGLGAEVVAGSLDDLGVLRSAAERSDGVIHMGFGGDFNDPDGLVKRDTEAINALGEALVDTGKPLMMTSGTFAMEPNRVSVETDAPDPQSSAHFRIPGEQACLQFAARGVRAVVMRFAPTVHGPGDTGFVPMLIGAARKAGTAFYIGDGANRWPAVHRQDAATLYRLAFEKAPAGSAVHATDESGVTMRTIADVIGRKLDLPVRSMTEQEAGDYFTVPFIAHAFTVDSPASSRLTRELVGWQPIHPTLLDDLEHGDYFDDAEAGTRWSSA